MINQCYRLFCSLMLFAIHLTANAALELELTQGVNGAEPLAILPFSVQGSMNKDIQQVIYNDLTHSGRFNVIPMTQKMVELNTPVNYMYWQQRKVDNIVQGQLRQDKQGRIQLTLHLDNAYKDPHPVAETLITTDAADWRDLAHHASDWIYEQITGAAWSVLYAFSLRCCITPSWDPYSLSFRGFRYRWCTITYFI